MIDINKYSEFMSIGLIQTTLDHEVAWADTSSVLINEYEGERIWEQIISGVKNISQSGKGPDIILMPELTIPNRHIKDLCNISCSINSIIIAGVDYNCVDDDVKNQAVLIIPDNWPDSYGSGCKKIFFGKYHFAREEDKIIREHGFNPVKQSKFYLFDAGNLGKFGVAICSDFFDIERFAIYQGQVQHIFILAYNQDITSFYFLAEAISRIVFCNVVICNTGYYGGSIAFSPYNSSFRRYIYKHEGAKLFNSQLVEIPVKSLIIAQNDNDENEKMGANRFKYMPPGYEFNDFGYFRMQKEVL
jgi:hypothetical protein